ncbi:MAG: FkbM family methyltransferase [Terriglobia bacterium]
MLRADAVLVVAGSHLCRFCGFAPRYDVGSHLGLYTLLLARVVGPNGVVVALEPHHETYHHLLQNVELNELSNVRAFEKALGERTGSEKLYLGGVVANFSLLPGGVEGFAERHTPFQWVGVVRGDEFVETEKLPVPRAVKIDVEGFEYSVIKGLQGTLAARECELVCCEVHPRFPPRSIEPAAIGESLGSLGYTHIEGQPGDGPYHIVAYKP